MNEDKTPTRAEWVQGPWTGEPDREEFRHAGLACLLNRGPVGAWCGYVAVPPGHPAHGKGSDDVDVSVHGGLTYAHSCQGVICHAPAPGEPDDVWWFGFDCSHYQDIDPVLMTLRARPDWPSFGDGFPGTERVYRDIAYVREETMRLAEQLAALA